MKHSFNSRLDFSYFCQRWVYLVSYLMLDMLDLNFIIQENAMSIKYSSI